MKNINNPKLLLEIEIIKSINDNQNISQINVIPNKIISQPVKETVKVLKNDNVENEEKSLKDNNKTIDVNSNKKIDLNSEKFEDFKKCRINNSLANFSKKERELFKDTLLKLDDYINDDNYSKYISIIKDGDFKSISNDYLLFIYKSSLMSNSFNMEINNIEQMFNKLLNKNYKVISVNNDEWEIIKKDYNSNKSKYIFLEEKIKFEDLLLVNNNTVKKNKKNSIDTMFDDIIEYE